MKRLGAIVLLLALCAGARAAFFQAAISVSSSVSITGISSGTPTSSAATITWTNTPAADGQVCYGLTTSYGTCTTRDASPVTSDTASLTGLAASTTYHYQINATASGFSQGFSADQTFATTAGSSTNTVVYSGVTDTIVRNNVAPTIVAAGSSMIDPDFGTTVFRVTQSGSCGQGAVSFMPNNGTGWTPTINNNDTAVMMFGGAGFFFVQPITITGSGLGATVAFNGSCVAYPHSSGNAALEFASTNPHLIYGLNGNFLSSWDYTSNTTVNIFNLTTIPGFTNHTLYALYGDRNDAWFGVSNNTQNVGTQLGFYNAQTTATAVVDIVNATVQLGGSAPVAMNGWTSTDGAGCVIHESIPSQDGAYWDITFDNCTNHPNPQDSLFWQVGTNNVFFIADGDEVGGHESMGVGPVYQNMPGSSEGSPNCSPFQWTDNLWPINNLGGGVGAGHWVGVSACNAVPPTTGNDETHQSWLNNVNDGSANTYPVMIAFLSSHTTEAQLYDGELVMFQMSPSYAILPTGPYREWANTWGSAPTVYRPVHMNNSNNAQNYISPNIGLTGNTAQFYSNWDGQITGSRTDDFLVILPGPASGSAIAISSVSSGSPGTTTATITWTNGVAAYGQVCYGTTTAYGTCTVRDTTAVTSDTASLTGLTSSTTYHYRVNAIANGSPEGLSSDATFATP